MLPFQSAPTGTPISHSDLAALARFTGRDPVDASIRAVAERPTAPLAVRIFSDLHFEFPSNVWDCFARLPDESDADARHVPLADVIVVAGDVNTPGTEALEWLSRTFFDFQVVYVPGNHDFYVPSGPVPPGEGPRPTYLETVDRLRERASRLGNVYVLVDSQVVIRGVRFVGGTLWTDLRLGTSSRSEAYATARRGMNDYRHILRKASGRHRHVRPEDTAALHRATVAYLDGALAVPHDGPTVVVTHHAPSPRSLDTPWLDLRHCYASNIEWLVEKHGPVLWVHGHLHCHSDYRVGRTRVVANPRGHKEELATSGFVQDLVVHV